VGCYNHASEEAKKCADAEADIAQDNARHAADCMQDSSMFDFDFDF
jgi:hypothetical protein